MAENLLFFFSALGVFNACLLAVYLIVFKADHQLADYFLGGLLLCLVVRVGVSCFHFFGTVPKSAIKLGLIVHLLSGPLILFFMKFQARSDKKALRRSLVHLAFWTLVLLLVWFSFDFATWNWRIRYVIHFVLTVYLVYTGVTWRKELLLFIQSGDLPFKTQKAVLVYLSLVLIGVGFAISLVTNYILGPLIFSIIFYLTVGYFLLVRQAKNEKHPSPQRPIDPLEVDRLNQRLNELMEVEKLHRNPDLTLESLAGRLSISRHLLSQLLNDHLNQNFYQYVNQYRIQEACHMLKENKQFSIEAIAHEVGFHSRSSFFSSFKKLKGMTPSRYREVTL